MLKTGYGIIRLFLKKLREDAVSAFAAQTAFFIILSFLPFLIFLLKQYWLVCRERKFLSYF